MPWLRRKWLGQRWRPGLDLANLGLLLAASIIVKVLWDSKALERWLPTQLYVTARWAVAVLAGLWWLLDIVGGLVDFRECVRSGAKNLPVSSRRDSDDAAV